MTNEQLVGSTSTNKRKILNDPVYGFISLPSDLAHDLIDHPFFQRLRRITQLGLSHLVYPGALHNRFHHALGAMHLMISALDVLKQKGQNITKEETDGAILAILLHDVGHGPFSHALEHSIVHGISHEDISLMIMRQLNAEFDGALDIAIKIFRDEYPKKFLHQLVSSQLDMDRLDYLRRDSFYTGVTEGNVGSERIIKMLNVVNDELVVEQKGIYSVEKFIVARRLMYWQVYLHKTVLSAESMLVNVLKRAKFLADKGTDLFCSPALKEFLYNRHDLAAFKANPDLLTIFCQLDDYDILGAIKVWASHEDLVLRELSDRLVNRKLFKIRMQETAFEASFVAKTIAQVAEKLNISEEEASYFVISEKIDNMAYHKAAENIKIVFKDGSVKDAAEASDHFNLSALSQPVEKFFLSYPVFNEH